MELQHLRQNGRLFELLRTPCGLQGEWRQLRHEAVVVEGKVQCNRCGIERQQCVQLGLQLCPVRGHYRAGEELPEATAVYAAWHGCVRAMHSLTNAGARQAGAAALGVGQAAAADAAGPEPVHGDVQERRAMAQLRPFRSHQCVRAGEAEFCMSCFSRAPRFKVAAWRQECCDGAAPTGACPKHILAAVNTCRVAWPPRHEGRGASIDVAAKAWIDSHVFRQLRPPKRRVAVQHT